MKRTAVLNVVGLTRALIGPATPRLARFLGQGAATAITPAFPAVTCTAQSTYLTGTPPAQHGIVGNGWYDRELAEVQFWKQSNHLVQGRKIWEELRELEPGFTCAKLFWWYNMYSTADWSITPRPMYPADGRKFFDIYSWPYSIRDGNKKRPRRVSLPDVLGPGRGRPDSARRARRRLAVDCRIRPLDREQIFAHAQSRLSAAPGLQPAALGPRHPGIADDLRLIDAIVGDLIDFSRSVRWT